MIGSTDSSDEESMCDSAAGEEYAKLLYGFGGAANTHAPVGTNSTDASTKPHQQHGFHANRGIQTDHRKSIVVGAYIASLSLVVCWLLWTILPGPAAVDFAATSKQ